MFFNDPWENPEMINKIMMTSQKIFESKMGLIVCSLILLLTANLKAQDSLFVVNGKVVSSSGKPLSDITVSIEDSDVLPAVTDESGDFKLSASSGEVWLIISPTSEYKKKRIFLNKRENPIIFLTPLDVPSGHDEVLLLSYLHSKRNILASYSDLNTQNIHHTPSLTVDEFMSGRTTGVHVVNRSGLPSSGAVTTIRGVSSIHGSNQPLYIIDGIPVLSHGVFNSAISGFAYNPLISVNPLDISKTTIVKDPVISATYGSQGSNGLVFVETLDPSATQTSIELDIRGGYSLSPKTYIPQLNAMHHKTLMKEVLFTSSIFEEQIKENYPNLFLEPEDERYIDYQHNTNWQNLIFENAYLSNINLKIKGGDEIARYGLSFGYLNSDGIIRETGYDGYNLRFVSLLNVFSWLKMNAGVALNYSSLSMKEDASVEQTSPMFASLAKSPLLNPYNYDLEGRKLKTLAEVDELGTSNPLAILENYRAGNDNYNFISNLNFISELTENLSINSTFSLSYNVLKETIFMPNRGMELYYNQEAINVSKSNNNNITSFYNNSYIRYKKVFSDYHSFSSNTGVNLGINRFELDWGLTKNAPANDQYPFLQDGQSNLREIGGENRNWNRITVYEYLNYSYKDKYLISASISMDGSSRVGENAANTFSFMGEPFGLFYSGAVGYRLSSEGFMRNLPWLEELKFRFSAGRAGNDDIGEANATKYYDPVNYRETAGLFPAVLLNDRLTYETVSQINPGIDLSLLGNRISLSMDYFISNTKDLLIYRPVEPYLGYDKRMENGGKIKNKGWEINAYFRLIDAQYFKWDVQTYISSSNNTVTDIKGGELTIDIIGGQLVNKVGAPANSFYGYVYEGVYSNKREASEAGLVNARGMPYKAGDAIYSDLSGPDGIPDGVINNFDKTVIGSSIPEYFGGILNSFSYKRWTLSGLIQFVYGNKLFNYLRYKNERMSGLDNQSKAVLERWQYENQETIIPRALWNDPIGNSDFSTRWIEDGSYLRIKNITISYKIPNQFLTFKHAEIYFSANNIHVFSDYLGYDPEFAYSYSNIHQGVDYGMTPIPRQFIGGIKIGL